MWVRDTPVRIAFAPPSRAMLIIGTIKEVSFPNMITTPLPGNALFSFGDWII